MTIRSALHVLCLSSGNELPIQLSVSGGEIKTVRATIDDVDFHFYKDMDGFFSVESWCHIDELILFHILYELNRSFR